MRLCKFVAEVLLLLLCLGMMTNKADAFFTRRIHARSTSSPIGGIATAPLRGELSSSTTTTELSLSPRSCLGAAFRACNKLRGGAFGDWDSSELISSSYDWCMNLGAPSALVAGAVIATIYENMKSGDLELTSDDSKIVSFSKKLTRLLLVTAFGLEVLSIFVTTVTGSMLLSRTIETMAKLKVGPDTTPISFLIENFEFEYLSAQLTFLMGLLNWLSAIALSFAIPTPGERSTTRLMNKFIASSLSMMIVIMVAFYNNHLTFYPNLWCMVLRYKVVTWKNFVWLWPPRPLAFVIVPFLGLALFYGFRTFFETPKHDN